MVRGREAGQRGEPGGLWRGMQRISPPPPKRVGFPRQGGCGADSEALMKGQAGSLNFE